MNQRAGVRRFLRMASLKSGRSFHLGCLAIIEIVSAEALALWRNCRMASE